MSKSLRQYKRRNNKTQRKRRSSSGGNKGVMMFNKGNLNKLGALLDNPHVLALHSNETCDHCKNFKSVWKRLARLNSELVFAEFDPEASPFAEKKLHPEINVSGVPTLVYINKIKNKRVEYAGERTEKAIMEWLMKHSDKRIKITIETEDKTPAVESFPVPESEPVSEPVSEPLSVPVSEPLSVPVSEPLSVPVSEPLSEPVSDTLSSDSVSDAVAAFPPAEAPTSVVGTIQNAASSVNNAIGSTVEKAKNALTQDIDLSGLFASDATAATAAPAVTPATANPDAATAAPAVTPAPPAAASLPADFQQAPIQPVPQVPSLGGKKRKITRRKKSKKSSSKKTKKSKK
jgi:hypothetical protein